MSLASMQSLTPTERQTFDEVSQRLFYCFFISPKADAKAEGYTPLDLPIVFCKGLPNEQTLTVRQLVQRRLQRV